MVASAMVAMGQKPEELCLRILSPRSGHIGHAGSGRLGHDRTHARQQTSGRACPAVTFLYLSVECPFNKFYGINCCPKLGAKLLDRFFHRRRKISPPTNNLTHRFFDGSQHFLHCNITVSSRHSAVASSSSR